MLRSLRKRVELQRKAGNIYGAIVTQARQPAFYTTFGIPDTPAGRYEMVAIHLFLVLERLRGKGPGAEDLARALVETFVSDMDDSVRELGTGDMGVARKVRCAVAGLYERSEEYRAALAAGDPQELECALARHALGAEVGSERAAALAGYVRDAAARLPDGGALLDGGPTFPAFAEAPQ